MADADGWVVISSGIGGHRSMIPVAMVAMAVKTLILATKKYNFDDFVRQTKKTSCLIWRPKNKAMRWENVLKILR